jgi:hypothetical protein
MAEPVAHISGCAADTYPWSTKWWCAVDNEPMDKGFPSSVWDTLDAKFGAADAGSELYIMESFHDFKITKDLPLVQQAHEIQCIAKDLELLKCALPNKFVAGCIIAKLPLNGGTSP